jgi:DNA polymerase epsilon subunit 4
MIVDEYEEQKLKNEKSLSKSEIINSSNSDLVLQSENNIMQIDENKISDVLDKILESNHIEFNNQIIEAVENHEKIEIDEEVEDQEDQDENLRGNYESDNQELNINSNPNTPRKNSYTHSQSNQHSHKKEKSGFTRLPISKIKNLMKMDPDIKLCQKNAYIVISKLTELFLQELSKNAHSVAKLSRRKTMNLEDIACAVKSIEKYSFIDVNSIFNVETVAELKSREEKFEKKIRQAEIKIDKKDKKEVKSEKNINKKNVNAGNMKIDKMFSKGE